MSQARFAVVLGVVAVLVAVGSFVAATAVLDDGKPDPPPAPNAVTEQESLQDPVVPASTTTTTAAPVATGDLATPTWIVVITSEADQSVATEAAQRAAAAGYETGVLQSDDYPSLNKGYWVAYAGPYADQAAAEAGSTALGAAGFSNTYARCAGTKKDCGGGEQPSNDDEGD
jgi:hypothetical protein